MSGTRCRWFPLFGSASLRRMLVACCYPWGFRPCWWVNIQLRLNSRQAAFRLPWLN